VDHRIDGAELSHLLGDVACLLEIREVTDDRRRAAGDQVPHRVQAIVVAGVDDHVMAAVQHRFRGQSTKTTRGTGDEDERHGQARFLVKNSSSLSNGMRSVLSYRSTWPAFGTTWSSFGSAASS
jgi:hypothetical protein